MLCFCDPAICVCCFVFCLLTVKINENHNLWLLYIVLKMDQGFERTKNKKKVVHGQARTIIFNVYLYMLNEACSSSKTSIMSKVADATGISLSTCQRICRAGAEGTKFVSPRKHINKPKNRSVANGYAEEIIRRVIYTFAQIRKMQPTMDVLFQAVKDEGVEFAGKITSFRKLIHRMGFRWKRTKDNRNTLVEKFDIRANRTQYLRAVKKLRTAGRPIVYIDETFLHSTQTLPLSWEDGSKLCLKSPVAKGKRLIIAHAGGKNGFIPGALLMFKSGSKTGDYQDEMNHANFMKWMKEQLIPNLTPNSVLVIDDASYHNVPVEPNPTSNWKKVDMQRWLRERNIEIELHETRPELFSKIQLNKPLHKRYAMDRLLAEYGHEVLRLPPFHPELNPIELIWTQVKNQVAAANVTFKLDDLWKLTEETFQSITVEAWEKVCEQTISIEDEYLEREPLIDEVEELINSTGEGDSDFSDWESEDDQADADEVIGEFVDVDDLG